VTLQRLGSETDPKPATAPSWLDAIVVENAHIGDRYWRVVLEAPRIAQNVRPGQFVLLSIPHPTTTLPVLPRPMAVYDCDASTGTIEVLYGVVGPGTRRLSELQSGAHMTVVGPLGKPFQVPAETTSLLLLGRGIGTCSLTLLARREAARGVDVFAVASSRHESAVIGRDLYERLGVAVHEAVDSAGTSLVAHVRSTLLARLDEAPPQLIATCGSERLAALAAELGQRWDADTQISIEAHMACGIGYCHGCAAGERGVGTESPLVCTEGPVFRLIVDSEEHSLS
jgi:dihydroorotate dehydrogenase electron transfer subunit